MIAKRKKIFLGASPPLRLRVNLVKNRCLQKPMLELEYIFVRIWGHVNNRKRKDLCELRGEDRL